MFCCNFAHLNHIKQSCSVKIKEVLNALEQFAPLPLQEGFDNAGLQIGLTETEVSGALLCLDVTEAVIEEAAAKGCNLIVAHHPLLFRGLKQVSDTTQVERCVRLAIQRDIAIYAAHTNLDNARGGVNYEIAERLGLHDVDFLRPEGEGGSGLIGRLAMPEDPYSFLKRAKDAFFFSSIPVPICSQGLGLFSQAQRTFVPRLGIFIRKLGIILRLLKIANKTDLLKYSSLILEW